MAITQAEASRRYRARHPERVAEARARYFAAHPAAGREATARWRKRHPERVREYRARDAVKRRIRNLANTYRITYAEAEAVLASKPTRCEICGRIGRISYDHDHATMQHRGWLCTRCNTSLGIVEDPILLAAAQAYLRKSERDV